MKKSSIFASAGIAAVGAVLSPTAHAATPITNNQMHMSSVYSTHTACEADLNAEKTKVSKAGYKVVDDGMTINGNDCFPSTTGWLSMYKYNGKAPLAGDFTVDSSKMTSANVDKVFGVQQAILTHSYTFPDQKSCETAYNGIMNKLKSLPEQVKIAPIDTEYGYEGDPNKSAACADVLNGDHPWVYRISYSQALNKLAPFGYEQVSVIHADEVDNHGVYPNGDPYSRYTSSYVLKSGTTTKTGTFSLK